MPRENPILGALRVVGADLRDLHRWLTARDPEHYWGPGMLDFTPDWRAETFRRFIRKFFSRRD